MTMMGQFLVKINSKVYRCFWFANLGAAFICNQRRNLPRWCYWLQTHDATLDELWLDPQYITPKNYSWLYKWFRSVSQRFYLQRPTYGMDEANYCAAQYFKERFWFRYICRMAWLFRNPAYGVANQLGIEQAGLIVLREVLLVNGYFQLFQPPAGRYGFTLRNDWYFTKTRYVRLYLGWKPIGDQPRLILATHVNPFRKQ